MPHHHEFVCLVHWLNLVAVTPLLLLFANYRTAPPVRQVTAPASLATLSSLPSLTEQPTPAAPQYLRSKACKEYSSLFQKKALGLECVPGSWAHTTKYTSPVFQSYSAGHPGELCLTASKIQTPITSCDQSEQYTNTTTPFQTFNSQIKARKLIFRMKLILISWWFMGKRSMRLKISSINL